MKNEIIFRKKNMVWLYLLMMITKMAIEYAYINVLTVDEITYPLKFSVIKYVYGIVWLSVLFICIQHNIRRPSTFLLEFFFVMEMIPLTIIYAMQDENTIYYTCVCIGMLLCELLVSVLKNIRICFKIRYIEQYVLGGFLLLIVLFLLITYKNNGYPTLTALNIYDVYKLRRSGLYKIGKYWRYIQGLLITICIPWILSVLIIKRKYLFAVIIYGIEFIIYLYGGQKSFLFIGVMVGCIVLWSQREKFVKEFWIVFLWGITTISIFANKVVIYKVFSLFIRRVLLVSANNKFKYYDFFRNNPKEGWAGIFPRWLFPISSPYKNGYTFLIGDLYYNAPDMNCNTGFLAEGFLRWGYIGLFISMIVFALILKLIDGMAKRNSYELALGCSISVIFSLSDGYLISRLMFGSLTIWAFLLLIYRKTNTEMNRKGV